MSQDKGILYEVIVYDNYHNITIYSSIILLISEQVLLLWCKLSTWNDKCIHMVMWYAAISKTPSL